MRISWLALVALLAAVHAGAGDIPDDASSEASEVAGGAAEQATEMARSGPALPERVENFRLIDQDGRSHELYRLADSKAVVLYIHGVGCPIVRQSVPALNRLRDAYAEQGVAFLMINANLQDDREAIAEEATDYEIAAPILHDESQAIVRSLGVSRTAEVIVAVPSDDWRIVYRGAVDDRFDYGATKPEAQETYLQDAIDAVLAGEPVDPAQTAVKGCRITFESIEVAHISYETDIAPLLQDKCVSCHTRGSVGPFALNSHRKVRGWAEMMAETIRTDRMPPWHADPAHNAFSNDRSLSPNEEAMLLAWLDAGAPIQEDEGDPLRDIERASAEPWKLGEPDLLLELPEVEEIPAEGIVEYRYRYVPTGLTEDKWVEAVQIRPTGLQAVHHALIFVIYPKEYRHIQPEFRSGLNGYFAAYLPGGKIGPYPGGSGQFLPAGSAFVFQMHYNATGRPAQDQTQMALYFHDTPPDTAYHLTGASETDFQIEPFDGDSPVEADIDFDRPVTLWGASPHMHYRGGRATFAAHFPDDTTQTLLNVPFYEFDWQPLYLFEEPVSLPANTRIEVTGAFDNSKWNPKNPAPEQWVFFGEQSFEEMFIGYIAMTEPRNDELFAPREIDEDRYLGLGEPLTEDTLPGTKWRLGRNDRFILAFEPNGVVVANSMLKGSWDYGSNVVRIQSSLRNIDLGIVHDELFLNGRPLKRIE